MILDNVFKQKLSKTLESLYNYRLLVKEDLMKVFKNAFSCSPYTISIKIFVFCFE